MGSALPINASLPPGLCYCACGWIVTGILRHRAPAYLRGRRDISELGRRRFVGRPTGSWAAKVAGAASGAANIEESGRLPDIRLWECAMKRFCRDIIHWLGRVGSILKKLSVLLVCVLLIAVVLLLLYWFPQRHVATDAENQTRATWAQVFGYLVGSFVLYFTWRRLTATERTVEIAQEGQITERFSRASEHVGSEEIVVRLGGIYALERIAKDSERDHWPIMEFLTAFVRERAPWWPENRSDTPVRSPKDIQAILTVIGRRKRTYQNGEDFRLDLFRTDLRKADLRAAHLEGANFNGACLNEANLQEAHLEKTDFWEAQLRMTNLRKTHLREASLLNADLEGAHLEGADLREAINLTQEQLRQAFTDADTKLPDNLARNGQDDSASG
jgi:membrane protein implicated in regulation of membrane protease activity